MGQHGSASGSLLLDLVGLEVVSAELARPANGSWSSDDGENGRLCGLWARAALHGRRLVRVRDLPIGGRPWCCAGISGSGAVVSPPVGYRPGPSGGWDRSAGGADRAGPRGGLPAGRQRRPRGGRGGPRRGG